MRGQTVPPGSSFPRPSPSAGIQRPRWLPPTPRVKKLLIAGELSKSTLLGGRPAAFAALLPAQDRKRFLDGLNATGTYKGGGDKNTREWVTAFVPGSTDLIGKVIKVHGQMTATATVKGGWKVLDVHVSYLFAYPVEPPGQPAKWMRLVAHRTDDYLFAHWEGSTSPLKPWVMSDSDDTPILCGTTDGYVHPDYTQSSGGLGKGAATDPYSLKATDMPGRCHNSLPT